MNEQESFLQKMITEQQALIKEQSATISRLVRMMDGEELEESGEPQLLNTRRVS